VIIRITHLIVC